MLHTVISLAFYNAIVILVYGLDKMFAKLNTRRIPEKLLLALSLLCGAPGAIIGMVLFHHKISKPAFRYPVSIMFILQVAAAACLVVRTCC